MEKHDSGYLDPKKHYLQIALNSTLDEARRIIMQLPKDNRIILEAGTPLIKRYGEEGIRTIVTWFALHQKGLLSTQAARPSRNNSLSMSLFNGFVSLVDQFNQQKRPRTATPVEIDQPTKMRPYVVADLKMMDRGSTEVEIASRAGASAAVALGQSPIESLKEFIASCQKYKLDSMVDMMNVDFPLRVLHQLPVKPTVVILHRGVDEERLNKEKQIPLHEIRRIKGTYDILIAIAGGDTLRETQRAVFNDADIVVVWKSFFQSTKDTGDLAAEFLKEIR
jgi:3-keto-L-gulonate-6-phosphate decarboxylase